MAKISWKNCFSIIISSLSFIFISQFSLYSCLTLNLNSAILSSINARNAKDVSLSSKNNEAETSLKGNLTSGVNPPNNDQIYQAYHPFQVPSLGFQLQPFPFLPRNNLFDQQPSINVPVGQNIFGANKTLGTAVPTTQTMDALGDQCDFKLALCGPNDLSKLLAKNYVESIKEYGCVCKQILANIACNLLGENKKKNAESIQFDTSNEGKISIKLIESDCLAIDKACAFKSNATLITRNPIQNSFSGLSEALQHHESFLSMGVVQKVKKQMKDGLKGNSYKIGDGATDHYAQHNRNTKLNIFMKNKNLEDSNAFSAKALKENSPNNANAIDGKQSKAHIAFLQKEDTQVCKNINLPGSLLTEENKKLKIVVSGLTDDKKDSALPIDAVYLTKDLHT